MADSVLGIFGYQAFECGLSVRMKCSYARRKGVRLLSRIQIELLVTSEAFTQRRAGNGCVQRSLFVT